ncbi:MAG: helix-turn-helix transcriptional regulator [Sphingomonas sp.]|nr:helix-turn-helix transcriptional regulator [Sphingomonas sp.]
MGLADAFARAPFEEGGWIRALGCLAEATGSARGQLIGIGGPSLVPFNMISNVDESILQSFLEIDGTSPHRNFRIAASGRIMEIVHEEHYARAQSRLRDDLYNDFCREHDLPHGMQTALQQGEHSLIGLAMLRTAREGPSDADQRQRFAEAADHALRAVRIQQAMDGQSMRLLSGSLEQLSINAVILDCFGAVRSMTPAAETELIAGTRLRLAGAMLRTAHPREQGELDMAILRALRAPRQESALVLHGLAGGQPAAAAVFPLQLDAAPFGFAANAMIVLRGSSGPRTATSILQQAMGLTASEAAVASYLAEGLDREEIAARRGVSPTTIHSQIKSIFAKAGVTREVELVLAVARLTRL